MNYKLAKQLKDAGFPQKGKSDEFLVEVFDNIETWDFEMINADGLVDRKYYYVPTLEELIDACRGGFGELAKNGAFSKYTPHLDKWVVWGMNKDISCGGKTPLEAVARLFIKLNK